MESVSAMARDYKAEYARRIAKAQREGRTRQAGRGHAHTPEHGGAYIDKAIEAEIEIMIPDFDELDRKTQSRLSRAWVLGYMSTGKRTFAKVTARIEFDEWYHDNVGEWGKEQWKMYREKYKQMFTVSQSR